MRISNGPLAQTPLEAVERPRPSLKIQVNIIIQRYRRMSGELKNQKLSLPHESSENPNCYIHFSDGKNITVTLKEGIIVNDLLKDVASYHGVDNQV